MIRCTSRRSSALGTRTARPCGEPIGVEGLLHSEGGGHQPDCVEPRLGYRGGGRIREVDQGDPNRSLDLVSDLVHRVRAQQQHLGSTCLEAPRYLRENLTGLGPASCDLQPFDVSEVTDASRQRAESKPPSRSRTSSFAIR